MKNQIHFSYLIIFIFLISCSSHENETDPIPVQPSTTQYTLTVNSGTGGTVSTSGGTYEEGSTVNVTATPNSEYIFQNWSNGSTDNPLTVTVNQNITLTANFIKRKYPLTINIQGEGTVREEIVSSGKSTPTEYNSGTVVRLTAIPGGEWSDFKLWSGDVNSNEKIIEITLNESKNINVLFEDSNLIVNQNRIRVGVEGVTLEDIRATFYDNSGTFHYHYSDNEYLFNGGVYWVSSDVDQSNVDPQTLPKVPHLILKKVNDEWILDQVHRESSTRLVRNPVKYGDELIITCSGEIGSNADLWRGDSWIGRLVEDDIQWRRINTDNERTFWHGVTAGDINGDGLTDIGGVPHPDIRLFIQNQDGSFTNQRSILNYSQNNNIPFTMLYKDVTGDGIDEIITADYGENNSDQLNNVQVYKFNNESQSFDRIFVSNQPEAFYSIATCPNGLGATSIQSFDFNGDNNLDLAIAREDADCGAAFEIWLGNGGGQFQPYWSSPIWDWPEFSFREFRVFDVNDDGHLDIVLRPQGFGTLFRTTPVEWDVIGSGGFILNNSIWINNGSGDFTSYNNENLRKNGVFVDYLEPFMRDGNLHFIGTFTAPDDSHYGEGEITLTISDIKVRVE